MSKVPVCRQIVQDRKPMLVLLKQIWNLFDNWVRLTFNNIWRRGNYHNNWEEKNVYIIQNTCIVWQGARDGRLQIIRAMLPWDIWRLEQIGKSNIERRLFILLIIIILLEWLLREFLQSSDTSSSIIGLLWIKIIQPTIMLQSKVNPCMYAGWTKICTTLSRFHRNHTVSVKNYHLSRSTMNVLM